MTATSILIPGTTVPTTTLQETSINEDLMGILNEVTEYLVSVAVPASIIVGLILIASILIAIFSLCRKRRKSKQFEVGDRFKFRYGSERRQFLKNSSKPVILEADQKSLSMGGTPQHRVQAKSNESKGPYLKMTPIKTDSNNPTSTPLDTKDKSNKNGTYSNQRSSDQRNRTNFFDMHMPGSSSSGNETHGGPPEPVD